MRNSQMTLRVDAIKFMLIILAFLVFGPEVVADEGTQTAVPVIIGTTEADQKDSSSEIRPSFLLNIELADTRNAQTWVASLFGSAGGRLSYGVTDRLETRLDYSWVTAVDFGTAFNTGLTIKYHLFDTGPLGMALQSSVAESQVSGGSATTSFNLRAPFTLKMDPFLLTAVGYLSPSRADGDSFRYGGEFGLAFSVCPFLAAIVESTIYSKNDNLTSGWVAGFALQPSKRITIPIVIGTKAQDNTVSLGILNLFAHIGFEL
jgi:hypothetical protein